MNRNKRNITIGILFLFLTGTIAVGISGEVVNAKEVNKSINKLSVDNRLPINGEVHRYRDTNSSKMYIYVTGIDDIYTDIGDNDNYFDLPIYIQVRNASMKYFRLDNVDIMIIGLYNCHQLGVCYEDVPLYWRTRYNVTNNLKFGFSIPYNKLMKYDFLVIYITARVKIGTKWELVAYDKTVGINSQISWASPIQNRFRKT